MDRLTGRGGEVKRPGEDVDEQGLVRQPFLTVGGEEGY